MSALDFGLGTASYNSTYAPAKLSAKMNIVFQGSNALCVGQMVCGGVVALLSSLFLFEPLLLWGVVVGMVILGTGALGILGNLRKNRDLINIHLVGAILGVLLSTQYAVEVSREVAIDCALGELFLKTQALEELTKDLAQHDMFGAVHDRMNELEEAIEIAHYGMDQTMSYLRDGSSGDAAQQDRDFLRRKLNVIRQHAHKIIDDIKKNPETSNEATKNWNPNDRARLQSKLATAEQVIDRIERHEGGAKENAFNPAEFERMVKGLVDVMQMPTLPGRYENMDLSELKKLTDGMENAKGVINKLSQDVHALDQLKADTDTLSDESRKRRSTYEESFKQLIEKARGHGEKDLTEQTLHHMPQHCVEEVKGIKYIGVVCFASAAFQLATIYISLCVAFRLPVKAE